MFYDKKLEESDLFDDFLVDGETNQKFADKFLKLSSSKYFFKICAGLFALTLALNIYTEFFMYNPKKRNLSTENIYYGSELNIPSTDIYNIINNLENELNISIDDCYDDYCVLNAIFENENLNENEKAIFYKAIDIIKDNPYVDKEAAYKSLLNVEVLHKFRPFNMSKNTQGLYSSEYESIGIFVDDPEYKVLSHEIIHCIFDNDNTKSLPSYFSEGFTELLANEYFSEEPFLELSNYPFEIVMVKMLCEVCSPDVVLRAYSTGDMSIIAKDIALVTGNEEEAMKALDMVDFMMRQLEGEISETDKLSNQELISGFIPLFRTVIESKYDKDDHHRISYFYNEILMANIFDRDAYDEYISDLVEYGADNKAYFSTKLKDKIANSNGGIKIIAKSNFQAK